MKTTNTPKPVIRQCNGYAKLKSELMDYSFLMEKGETPQQSFSRYAMELKLKAQSMIAKADRISKAIGNEVAQ